MAGSRNPIPFQSYEPDKSVLSGSNRAAKGVISAAGRYAPLQEPEPIGSAARLADVCLGSRAFYATTGTAYFFAGTPGKLYRMDSRTPADVSKGGGYAANREWAWQFEQFGNNVVAVARGVAPQRFVLGSSSQFADLAGAPAAADVVGRVREHLLMASGRTLYGSAFNNITDWTPDLATQAFETNLSQAAGVVQAIVGGEQGVIFQERGIVRATYTGGAAPFTLDEVEGGRGCCSPNGVTQWGRGIFAVSEDGLYFFNGLESQGIGQGRVDREFVRRLTYPYRHRITTALDANKKCWMVAYPADGSTTCNAVLIYSFADDRWTHDEIDTEMLIELPRPGVSLEDSAAMVEVFGSDSLEALTDVSMDSPAWTDSRRQWGCITPAHEICTFDGVNRAAELETSAFEGEPGRRTFVRELWPVTDATPGDVTGEIMGQASRLDQTVTSLSSAAMNDVGFCPVLADARFLRARVEIAAGAVWTEATGVHWAGKLGGDR